MVRAIIGTLLILYALVTDSNIARMLDAVLLIVGILLIFSGSIRFCPLYKLLGVNTCNIR
jgi:uncharacterized membrane protein YgdD (TMEM256/DUF423 family)